MPAFPLISDSSIETRFSVGIHRKDILIGTFSIVARIDDLRKSAFIVSSARIINGQSVLHEKTIDRLLSDTNVRPSFIEVTRSRILLHYTILASGVIIVSSGSPDYLIIISLKHLINRTVGIYGAIGLVNLVQSVSTNFRIFQYLFEALLGYLPFFRIIRRKQIFSIIVFHF